jgi:RNA polymerase sigma-70 factor, ECF subfamily
MTDRTVIRQAMAMLSSPHRAMIYRAYYLERTTAQIAAEHATTEHVVRAELHDAMQALRRILRDAHVTV